MGTWEGGLVLGESRHSVGCDLHSRPSPLWARAGLKSCQGGALALEKLLGESSPASDLLQESVLRPGMLSPPLCRPLELGALSRFLVFWPLYPWYPCHTWNDLLGAAGSRKAACQPLCLS